MATLISSPNYKVRVSKDNGSIRTTAPLSLRNVIRDSEFIPRLEFIGNVSNVNKIERSTLVYNESTELFEIKMLNLDGGEF